LQTVPDNADGVYNANEMIRICQENLTNPPPKRQPHRDACLGTLANTAGNTLTNPNTNALSMYINEKKNLFHQPRGQSNPYRVMLLILIIVVLIAVLRSYAQGEIWPPFVPTPTPTRTVNSYVVEGVRTFRLETWKRQLNPTKRQWLWNQ
jgi:hypothetical protein